MMLRKALDKVRGVAVDSQPAPEPAASPAEIQLREDNAVLRELLASRISGALLYADDGELQDNSALPFIDFRRDPAVEISRKLMQRNRR